MSSNVVQIPTGPLWRVLIAHERGMVRHALRTLIEAEDVAVVEVADGEAALTELDRGRFDLLILQLDLPEQDAANVVLVHQLLMAHPQIPLEPPDIILTLPPEVRDNKAIKDHLQSRGCCGGMSQASLPQHSEAALAREGPGGATLIIERSTVITKAARQKNT